MTSSSSSDLCGVCLGSFRDARVLPCLHSLCKECVHQLSVTATDGEIRCPICRWCFRLPPGGAADLPTDATVSVTGVAGTAGGWPQCPSCIDDKWKKKPSLWCKRCRLPFCDKHVVAHILSATSSGEVHVVVPLRLVDAESRAQFGAPPDELRVCAQHDEALLFHCRSCDVSICGHCTAIGEHKLHQPVRFIKDIVEERKKQVRLKVEKLENDVVRKVERSLTDVDKVAAELSKRADQVRADIREAEKKSVDMVKAHARQMIQDVDDLEQSRHKVLDHQRDELKTFLEAARNASRFSGRVMELETTREETLFSLLESLETRTTGLLSTHINEGPQHHSRLIFEAASDTDLSCKTKESIGKIIPSEASAKHSEIKGDRTRFLVGQGTALKVRAKDHKGECLGNGGDIISTRCACIDGEQGSASVNITDNGDGSYALLCVCSSVGSYELEVYINGEKMVDNMTLTCVDFQFDPNEAASGVSVSEDKRRAFHEPSCGWSSILGSFPMCHGEYRWKWKIGLSTNIMLGVAAKPFSRCGDDYNRFAYCWYNGSTYYQDGVNCAGSVQFSANDTFLLTLDCDRHILQITNLRTGANSTMTNLPDKEYFQYVTLYDQNSSVEFVE